MLISSLCSYYDILSRKGKVLPEGYSSVSVHYLIGLSPDGIVEEIIDFQKKVTVASKKGKLKEIDVPQSLTMPKRTEKPGIDGNIVEHRPLYIFGLNYDGDAFSVEDKTNKAKKSHQVFIKSQNEFFYELDSEIICAYKKFVNKWDPELEKENSLLKSIGKKYPVSGFAFCLTGRPDLLLHEDPVLINAWNRKLKMQSKTVDRSTVSQCCITGEEAPISRIHKKIMGFPNGAATGNVLVNFKSSAFESYGKSQSYNSNISEDAMNKYSEALNYIVKARDHKAVINGVTFLHWAMSDDEVYDRIIDASVFNGFDDESDFMDANETNNAIKHIMEKAKRIAVSEATLEINKYLDADIGFYMVGIKANSARLAIHFFYKGSFAETLHNIAQHQTDMQIGNSTRLVSLWSIGKELISPKSSNDEIDPALMNKMVMSIINGYYYPAGLMATVLRRIKVDSDVENNSYIKLNQTRVGIIKAYLNRKARLSGEKEEISMSLNKENKDAAYLCGRLFAVLEKLQIEASNNSLNRTIKDAYFSSACSTPKVVFPQLIKLAQHHINKAQYGGYWNYQIGEIVGCLGTDFPRSLSLDEQGKFVIGYYQQYWSKNESKKVETAKED